MEDEWMDVIMAIDAALKGLSRCDESHDAAMAQDRLYEARFWTSRAAMQTLGGE